MVCRHAPGDPACSSNQPYYPSTSQTPDSKRYQIEDVERVGPHLVLKVLYPNCSRCSYEGHKVMVFLNVSEKEVLKWKEIDPHFRPKDRSGRSDVAPSPAARFPASKDGWTDALCYARGKDSRG